jgi:hypothetical protein
MDKRIAVLYAVTMAAVIVGDLVFFRNRFWERLMVNIGIVLVFGAFYLSFSCAHDRAPMSDTPSSPLAGAYDHHTHSTTIVRRGML